MFPLDPPPPDNAAPEVIWDARNVLNELKAAESADDPLEADARVERIPRMTVKDGTERPLNQDDQILAINNIKRFVLKDRRVSAQRLAKMAGMSPSAISELLRNKYRGDLDGLLRRCEAAINEFLRREDAPGSGEYIETRVARAIHNILKTTSKLSAMAVFYGVSSMGKTMALEASCRLDFPSAILIKCNRGNTSPLKFCQAVLQQICVGRVDAATLRSTADAFNLIVKTLKNSSRMIIADEADCLEIKTLNLIRQIHDATGDDSTRCPVVLAGRPNLARKISRTATDEEIGGSLRGRIVIERNLLSEARKGDDGGTEVFSVEEIMRMLAKSKLRVSKEGAHWLCRLVNVTLLTGGAEQGGLRSLKWVSRLAASMKRDQELTPDLLAKAFKLTRDRDTAASIVNLVESMARKSRESATAAAATTATA